jgi:hypothetical protein
LYRSRRYHATGGLAASDNSSNTKDRESLNPRRSEGTKSGYDDQLAEKTDAAFNPKKTDPAAAMESAAQASNGNPLDASGANQEFSKSSNPSEKSTDDSDKKTRSKGSIGKKHGKVAPM